MYLICERMIGLDSTARTDVELKIIHTFRRPHSLTNQDIIVNIGIVYFSDTNFKLTLMSLCKFLG